MALFEIVFFKKKTIIYIFGLVKKRLYDVVLTIKEIKKIAFNKCTFLPYKLVFKIILNWLFKNIIDENNYSIVEGSIFFIC